MDSFFQPAHLFFILLIIVILFGPGKLPNFGQGLGRAASDLRGVWHGFRGALFMAKGVDPAVGRDVGDMLPEDDADRSRSWFTYLLAILIGNTLYFFSSPFLPVAARLDTAKSPGLPALVDLWFCLFILGALKLTELFRRRNKPKD
jgi:TatA/E family protein of Tat protein translocase